MHALFLLAACMLVTNVPTRAATLPGPAADKDDHHDRNCLSGRESRDIIERYTGNFEALDEASVNKTFAEDFTYESDSTSFFLLLDPGTQTIASRSGLITALRTDQAIGPAFTAFVNLYTHTCDTIVFRYRLLVRPCPTISYWWD